MMRILYLSQLIPFPANAGPKVRILHVLEYLVSAGHDVTLLAFRRDNDTPSQIAKMESICAQVVTVPMRRAKVKDVWHLLRSLPTRLPFIIARDAVAEMTQQVKQLVQTQQFDAIHADQLWMAQYALQALDEITKKGDKRPKMIMDQHNAVFLIPERMVGHKANFIKRAILAIEARKLAAYELKTCAKFDHVAWVSDDDRRALAQISPDYDEMMPGTTIPIGVDISEKAVIEPQRMTNRVTFLGGLHWPPNSAGMLWFVHEVWPRVHAEIPEALLTVIGNHPPEALRKAHLTVSNIDVTGYVDDPVRYLEETAAFIVPLHAGGGMRVKIVDSWAWGMPIVSTAIGAEGIQYHDGDDLLIADSAEAFAEAVVRLLREPEMNARLRRLGRANVEQKYDWKQIYKAWDGVYA